MHQSTPLWREFAHVVRRKVAAPRQVNVGDPVNKLCGLKKEVPPYPYGPATAYKQGDRGLYGGKILQFGHKISDYGNKHVRIFNPNVQKVTLWSEALKKQIRMNVVSSVLKTITREGGLDKYLIKDTPQRVKQLGSRGWELRYQVLSKLHRQELAAPRFEVVGDSQVYGKAEINGSPVNVLVGKTRLAKLCYNFDKDGKLKEFMKRASGLEFQELLDLCLERGVDISKAVSEE